MCSTTPPVLSSPSSAAVIETPVRIKFLVQPTRPEWVEQAIAHLDTILLDHSHCERKAASVAINLMFRYPSHKRLVDALTDIAQEELDHFRQVNQQLERRHISLAPSVHPLRLSLECRCLPAGTPALLGYPIGLRID